MSPIPAAADVRLTRDRPLVLGAGEEESPAQPYTGSSGDAAFITTSLGKVQVDKAIIERAATEIPTRRSL